MTIELPKATMRTYRKSCGGGHYDEYDVWKCPVCGNKNEEYDVLPDDNYQCLSCDAVVKVTYRIMRGKNY